MCLFCILSIGNLKACPHSDTLLPTRPYPFQQGHPDSATPYEVMGANYIQTTIPTNLGQEELYEYFEGAMSVEMFI